MPFAASPEPAPSPAKAPRSEPAPILARMVEASAIKPSDRVLCYGCGRGADVAWLKRHNFDVDGYDPHPPFGYTAPPSGKYDIVLLVYLMTRLRTDSNRREVLAKALEYVRPGGHLVLVSRNWRQWAGDTAENGAAVQHVQTLLPEEAIQSVRAMDFANSDPLLCLWARKSGTYTPRNPVEWVTAQEGVETLCRCLLTEPILALDVETTLEEPRKLCTIQLGVPGHTWIIDALAIQDFAPIKALMENPNIEKVIHNAQFEEQMLAQHRIRIINIFDTLIASRKKYKKGTVAGHKLDDVCERELGIYLDKTLQTSDWTLRPLSEAQLAYAAIDAEVLVELHRVFHPPQPPQNLDLFAEG